MSVRVAVRRYPALSALASLPRWAQETLASHAGDARPQLKDPADIERGATGKCRGGSWQVPCPAAGLWAVLWGGCGGAAWGGAGRGAHHHHLGLHARVEQRGGTLHAIALEACCACSWDMLQCVQAEGLLAST